MPVLNEALVRQLATQKSESAPFTSCYLDIDGSRHPHHHDVEVELDRVLRHTRDRLNGDRPSSVDEDLQRIERHVKGGLDRSGVRGLAIFACSANDFWEVVELPLEVRSQIVVQSTPYVRQLERIISGHERFGILLADKQRARMFVMDLGKVTDATELFEALPRHDDDGGEWDKDHVRDHVDEAANSHLRHTAEAALHVFQEQGFDQLLVAAADDVANKLEKQLHPYLRERLAGRLPVLPTASIAEVQEAAREAEARVERDRQASLVQRLRDAVGAGGLGATGLDSVLSVLGEKRVDTLLVSRGFEQTGWACSACDHLALVGPTCPHCDSAMERNDDIVEAAIESALRHSSRVVVCDGNADLDVLGRIGALLRY